MLQTDLQCQSPAIHLLVLRNDCRDGSLVLGGLLMMQSRVKIINLNHIVGLLCANDVHGIRNVYLISKRLCPITSMLGS